MSSGFHCNSLPAYEQDASDVTNGVHFLYYAVKATSGRYGGWAVAQLRCTSYEEAKVVSDGDDSTRPEELSPWKERFPYVLNGWVDSDDVVVTCVDETGK